MLVGPAFGVGRRRPARSSCELAAPRTPLLGASRAAAASALALMSVLGLGCMEGPKSPGEAGAFPLAPGAFWVYRGPVKWTSVGVHRPEQAEMTWRTEVTGAVHRQHVSGFLLRGFPSDLSWYEAGEPPSERLVVRVGPTLFYLLEGERARAVLARLRDEQDLLQDLVRESELFLALPLERGQVLGETAMITRTDLSYCWTVEGQEPFEAAGLSGPEPPPGATEFVLALRSRPDHQVLRFTPGIGITGYRYVHHGTVSGCDLELVEWGRGRG